MSDTSSSGPNPFPEARYTNRIQGEFLDVAIVTRYRGKTNSYVVERMHLLSIMDSSGREIEGRWEEGWMEIAPGIEMRREHTVSRMRIGARSHEHVTTGCIRIHRRACPVHIHFRQILEYNDYFDYEFSSSDSTDYWVRYEG